MDCKAKGWFLTPLGATPGRLRLPPRAFEPQMSPPYESAVIQMLSLVFSTFYIEKIMFFELKGVILTTPRGNLLGPLRPLAAPRGPCAL